MRDRIEDLSVHARRGELSETGLRQLGIALRSSHEARLLHEAGCEFDQLDSVLPGDDAVARCVISRVILSRKKARRTHRRYFQVALAGFAWTAAAAAAAPLLVGSEVVRPVVTLEETYGERLNKPTASWGKASRPELYGAPEVNLAPTAPSNAVDDSRSLPDSPAPKKGKPPRAVREFGSSTQAYAEANRLRRLGRTSDAIAQYVSLQKYFPTTDEAINADLALGLLRLQFGTAETALGHFRRYLVRNTSSPLVPEALFGEAQALNALGRKNLALRSYASLIRRYPESAYASAARARLQDKP